MDARCAKLLLVVLAWSAVAANYRTPNFVVTAPTPEIAQQVGQAAEKFRKELAVAWLGREMPRWYSPCPIQVMVGNMGAGGATSFNFDRGEVYGWQMNIQGPLDRVLDSVLPHEVSHTVFATHFRCPLPRWADEGAATLAEHESEKVKQVRNVQHLLGTSQRIPLRQLLAMRDYPPNMQDVLTLYAEGYVLAELLVQKGGKARYLKFLGDAQKQGWDRALQVHYQYRGIDDLERQWQEWVLAGGPLKKTEHLAEGPRGPAPGAVAGAAAGTVVRAQNSESEVAIARRGEERVVTSALSAPAPKKRSVEPAQVEEPREAEVQGLDRSGGVVDELPGKVESDAPRFVSRGEAVRKGKRSDNLVATVEPERLARPAVAADERARVRGGSRLASEARGSRVEDRVSVEGITRLGVAPRGGPAAVAADDRGAPKRTAASRRTAVLSAERAPVARRAPQYSEFPGEAGERPLRGVQ